MLHDGPRAGLGQGRHRSARSAPHAWREPLALGALAALLCLVVVVAWPHPDDASAHLYRTFLVNRGTFLWDNLWYGGDYPLASYSLLYYLLAAPLGNVPVVVGAVALSVALFATVIRREWGPVATWPGRAFVVLAMAPLITGTYAYALGVAALLGSLRAVQGRRRGLALALAAATLGTSPLAFAFLCLVLIAVVLARPRVDRGTAVMALGLLGLGGVELIVLHAFHTPGLYPFLVWNLVGVVGVSLAGVLLALRLTEGGRLLAALFIVWGGAGIVGYAVRSPLGDNLDRLRYLAFPLMLLAVIRVRFRPRLLAAVGLAAGLGYAVVPDVVTVIGRHGSADAHRTFWQAAITFLHTNAGPQYRVEVVQTSGRWEAYWLPRAGLPLARGWYRQIDLAENGVLYHRSITPTAYRTWLRSLAIRYVVLPNAQLDTSGVQAEASLIRSGRSGLVRVFATPALTIYELPRPAPLLTGPAPAQISTFDHGRIAGAVAAPGSYDLRVRFMPYWHRESGAVCLARGSGGMTVVHAASPGRFVLTVPDHPGVLLRTFVSGRANAPCDAD